jgi:hypothetical protein
MPDFPTNARIMQQTPDQPREMIQTPSAHVASIFLAMWPWCFPRPTRISALAFCGVVVKKRVVMGIHANLVGRFLDMNDAYQPTRVSCRGPLSDRHATSTAPRIRLWRLRVWS